jgi:hypothetical protein
VTVQELIDELEGFDPEAEVRFLAQPAWPFEYTIAAVVEPTDQPPDLSGYRETPTPPRAPCRGPAGLLRRPAPLRVAR